VHCNVLWYCMVYVLIASKQFHRVGQKSRPLRLTVYIFKTSEQICAIFRTLQRCLVLNTSVRSVMDKFITSVVPPSDKINNSVLTCNSKRDHCIQMPMSINLHNFCHNWTSFNFKCARYFIFIRCLIQSDGSWRKTKTRYPVVINS